MPGARRPRVTMQDKDATTDKPPYLRIERLKKQFGSFWALKDISLEIFPGEFVCFLGPSGCGKTTLLRAIAGLDIQTSGRIFQADKEISNLPASQRDFGIVFQSYALFPNLTVADNVGYGLVSRRMPKVEIASRVADLLRLVGLPDSGPKYPAQLSGGMQQRVALARALANDPKILLLDEPFGALDNQTRALMQELLLSIWEQHRKTVLFVTHDVDEAIFMANRCVVFSARPGRIKNELAIALPYPRHYTVKTTPRFSELKAVVTEDIRAESLKTAQMEH